MNRTAFFVGCVKLACLTVGAATTCTADPRVIVSATADAGYTAKKYEEGKIRPEKYVVLVGNYIPGHMVDNSIDRMPFERIAEVFAPELARREYWPAKNKDDADLLIVVHWGTTSPQVSMLEMMARTTAATDTSAADADRANRIADGDNAGVLHALGNEGALVHQFDILQQETDALSTDLVKTSSAHLLGYSKAFRKYNKGAAFSPEERSLRHDLQQPRYFIILKAYDLRASTRAARSRAVWTVHLNMSSPGNNFRNAIKNMSSPAVNFVGRSLDTVATTHPEDRKAKVEVGMPVIIHDKPAQKK